MLIIGILLVAVGVIEFVVASVMTRRQAVATGGLGASSPPPGAIILRRTALMEIVIGIVFLIIGLV